MPVPQSVIDALTSVQVTTASGQQERLPAHVQREQELADHEDSASDRRVATRRAAVIIIVTFRGSPTVLMDGVVTRQEVAPSSEPGQSTLTCTGEDSRG